jgi:hypothetical protein
VCNMTRGHSLKIDSLIKVVTMLRVGRWPQQIILIFKEKKKKNAMCICRGCFVLCWFVHFFQKGVVMTWEYCTSKSHWILWFCMKMKVLHHSLQLRSENKYTWHHVSLFQNYMQHMCKCKNLSLQM